MSRPLSDTIPDEIAEIIRSNSDWGDLTRFAEKEGLKRSTVYNLVLYRNNKTLLKLYNLALTLNTTVDEIYDLLLIQNIPERKARFRLLMAKAGIENLKDLGGPGIDRTTISRYLNKTDAASLFKKSYNVSKKMGISLHSFATAFATHDC